MRNKTIHIDPMPPPLGGIAVYLHRLSKKNSVENKFDKKYSYWCEWKI